MTSFPNKTAKAGSAQRILRRHRVAGFTLIELMVTIAIGVTLMVVAAPSFIQFRKNAQLSDAVSNLILATGSAKSAALKTGRDTYVIVNSSGSGWQSGWFVFVDNNWNQVYDAGTDDVLFSHDAISSDITVSTPGTTSFSAGYVLFNGSGFPKTKAGAVGNGTLVMALPAPNGRSSSIVIDTAGRVRSCTTGSAGCTAQ
ncbi:MAG: GspH/FimT family pseudopilin [Candidatus Saccharibacteria bacterium]|nr:GspH/FimT family pseudopilin [Rhodoferax sp.]